MQLTKILTRSENDSESISALDKGSNENRNWMQLAYPYYSL